jgi:hypothetical protein
MDVSPGHSNAGKSPLYRIPFWVCWATERVWKILRIDKSRLEGYEPKIVTKLNMLLSRIPEFKISTEVKLI